jgi:predicted MFS family arabinose efflux permease
MLSTFKQIPRGIWITFFAIVGNSFGWSVTAYMALFLHLHRGFSVTQVGAVMAGFGLGALIGAYLSGRIADKYPPHKICLISLFVNSITILAVPFVHQYLLMMLVTIIMGTANSAFSPANRVYIMAICPVHLRNQVTNIRYTVINIGIGSGIFFCSMLSQLSMNMPFFVNCAILVLAGIFLKGHGDFHSVKQLQAESHNEPINTNTNTAVPLSFWLNLLFLGLLQSSFAQIRATMPLYLYKYYHVSQFLFGHLFLLNCILIVLLQIPLSMILSRFNNYVVASAGAIAIGLGFTMLAFNYHYWWAVLATAIWTLGEMVYFPISQVLVYDLSPANRKGWGMGVYQFCYALANIVGPAAGSLLLGHGHPYLIWVLSGVFGLLTAIALQIMRKSTTLDPVVAN